MHIIRETEKDTQKRVIEFSQDALNYTYLGNWADSVDENSNIIPEDLAEMGRVRRCPAKAIRTGGKATAVSHHVFQYP